jgi:apolipoprotein N-acyltransferase
MRARNSYLLAVLSGILLLLSLPPFKFGGVLGWFAFVPVLIALVYETRRKRMDRLAMIAGLGSLPIFIGLAWFLSDILFSLEYLFWLWFIIGLALALSLAVSFYGNLPKDYWKPKQLPSRSLQYLPSGLQIIVIPVVLTAIEFLALNIPGVMRITGAFGFWSVAKTQWLNPPILKLASFTGMYGVTFLVLLVNCAIAYGIVNYVEAKRVSKAAIGVLVILALIFSWGFITVPSQKTGDITTTVIQVSQKVEDLPQQYLGLSERSLEYHPQIVIWPALIPRRLVVEPYADFARAHDVYLIGFGGEGIAVVSPEGDIGSHALNYHLITIPRDIGQGDIKSLFFPEIQGIDTEFGMVGIVDCAESGSTLPTRDLVNKGVQFLVVTTGGPNVYSFSWSLGTNAIYRAAEHHMFTACVVGDYAGSMLIDPCGRVINDIAPEPEIVAGKIAFTSERTFYSKYGDIFGWTITGLLILLIGYNLYLKRKRPFKYCEECLIQIPKDSETCEHCGASQKKPPLWKRILFHEYYEHVGRSKKPKK